VETAEQFRLSTLEKDALAEDLALLGREEEARKLLREAEAFPLIEN
jgi:hypothetical protein